MARWIEPVTLGGDTVTLEPLGAQHREALAEACVDGDLHQLWYTFVPGPETVGDYIDTALHGREHGGEMPFAVRDNASDTVIGATRYCHVDEPNRRLEIGYTWYAERFQRSAVNTECKRLLLGHAFETLDAIAVEFRTHWHNRASRAAIARLGAKQDGVLRNHQVSADGLYRDTVVFSIINLEWPAVRQNLDFRLRRGVR
ncbi:GNAT family N-acetyltransferase [Alcanivorax sp. N3-2A]|nr:GNAT family N-acetyltransferase [Alcanivorax sp. N3-2A]|tara:strand:- start:8763 stop:9362 length:600 start_codon:yes stop_codon:yes gene_type:complete